MAIKLTAQSISTYANFASLPTPIGGIYELAVTLDTGTLYLSNGVTWNPAGSGGGNVDGGNASTVYGASIVIDGGGA